MIHELLNHYFDRPLLLVLIIPLFFVLLWITKKDFVKLTQPIPGRNTLKFWFFLSRFAIFALLITAIASPYTLTEKLTQGEPRVAILADNSTSYTLYDTTLAEQLRLQLKRHVKTELRTFGTAEKSDVADTILENLQTGGSVLLISDGHNNFGSELNDVALHAANLNSTINAVELTTLHDDAKIEIHGPAKTTPDVETIFTITVDSTKQQQHRVRVTIDGTTVLDKTINKELKITQQFQDGYHQITAELINENDYFPQNNAYHKTVKVVKKPKLLLLTQHETPLTTLLTNLYELDVTPTPPPNLNDYYAILINDLPNEAIDPAIVNLNEYASDGNGLVLFGGRNSYERGNYKNSALERILPVTIATAEKLPGDVNIIILIDISASTGAAYGGGVAADVEKALAISVLRDLKRDHRVGIAAFDVQGRTVANLDFLLNHNLNDLESKIKALQTGGGTLISAGLTKATEMLAPVAGTKNIILISDGHTTNVNAASTAAKAATDAGIKIFTIGVGETTNENIMQTIADTTGGTYFRATEANKLKLLFGEPDQEQPQDRYGVTFSDKHHFITQNLDPPTADIYGFNSAVPKSTAKLIAVTTTGDPLLAAWRFGLGRVASVLTDDGTVYAGELLSKDNSALLIRTINWAIGDPERKNKNFIDIPDTRAGENAQVLYKSDQQPRSDQVTFYKIDEDLYQAHLPVQKTGFQTLLGAQFAVNYAKEYAGIGINPELRSVVAATNGQFFQPDDVQEMVDAITAQSKRTVYKKWYYRWAFAAAALILFLLEILFRKIFQYKAR